MKDVVKIIISSLVMGILLPQLLFGIADQLPVPAREQEATESAVPEIPERQMFLPVLVSENVARLMELEEYVLGVVLAEMPASFEKEALKAQAVVARTYALRCYENRDKHPDVAVCTDPACCQAYLSCEEYLVDRGLQRDVDRVCQAVAETAGQVLTYEGRLIEATYFSCSGGRTEDAQAVWGEAIPYLQAVDSPGEEQADSFYEKRRFSALEFSQALGRTLAGSPETWLGKCTYTKGGGVAYMVIGGVTYTGVTLRSLLGLNSTAFTMTADETGITVETLGKGHRVGMSQYGADAMAVQGSGYEEILRYYYQGTRIDKWSSLQ